MHANTGLLPRQTQIDLRFLRLVSIIRPMPFKLSAILSITAAIFKERADLIAENMALRHQLSCLIHRGRQPKLRPVDRVFWVLLSRFWNGWRESLAIVKPATVLAWHRKGFKLFWRWKRALVHE